MIFLKINYLTGSLFLFSQIVLAAEYVPPPSGPYKSSGIVNTNLQHSSSSAKIYRFPSDGLIQSEPRVKSKPAYFYRNQRDTKTQDMVTKPVIEAAPVAPVITKPVEPDQAIVVKPVSPPMTGHFTGNPWAPDSMPQSTDHYPGYWNNQQYSYPQQNPYGYGNQNNFMNNAMNGMPSPWSAMPMQPFFSGN